MGVFVAVLLIVVAFVLGGCIGALLVMNWI